MKICLSQIPEKERQAYIREEAINRVYNKINEKFKLLRELKRI
jgi:DNA-binding IclR family transcriptional regulator